MSSRSGSKDGGPAEMLFASAFALGLFLVLASVLVPVFPPLQGYWESVYQGVLANRMMIEGAETSAFVFQPHPVPNSFSQGLIAVLLEIGSPSFAAKIVLLLYVGLALLVYSNLRLLGPEVIVAPAMMIIFSISFGSLFLSGHINNAFGNLILLHYFVKLLRREPSVLETFCYALILFFCHSISFAVFGLIVIIHVLWREVRWENALALFPTWLMFLFYFARADGAAHELGGNLSGISDFLYYKAYTTAKLGPYHNFFYDGVGDFERFNMGMWIGIVANAMFALLLLAIALLIFLGDRFSWTKHAAFVSAAVLIVAYPFIPVSASTAAGSGERFLTIAVLLLIPLAISVRVRTQLAIQAAGLVSLCILPVLASFGMQAVKYEDSLVESREVIRIQEDDHIRHMFWQRPFLGAYRAQDIRHVLDGGLKTAAPIAQSTGIIAPRETTLTAEDKPDT